MSFDIKCNSCGNTQTLHNTGDYVVAENIDLLVMEDENDDEWLEFFCNNKECKRKIIIRI